MAAKRLLKYNDKRFRLLFEESPQPMWVLDPASQRILEANAAVCALYGYSAEEFRAMTLSDVQSPEEARRFVEGLRNPARPAASAWRHHTSSGRALDVELAVHRIQYGGQWVELAVLMDITGRLHLEEQLRQAQKMEAVGMLAGGIAHDFNNLLTIITGYSQLILNRLSATDPNRSSAEAILKAGEKAGALTKQLLAFSRRQVLQPRVLDLNKLVTALGSMLQRLIGEDIDLRLALQSDLGRLNADPSQVEQVLMNLVVNARDAMPDGGILTIETANVCLDEAYTGSRVAIKPGPYILLAVSDNGTGMDAGTRGRLFEPFFTTKGSGKGTGLGLSTVFGIVKQSGGSVEVYSEAGHGTSVKVYLPRIDQPEVIESEPSHKHVTRGSETILIVEDDEMVRTVVHDALHREGYTILDTSDPAEACDIVNRHHGPIHLMITDVVMPKVSGRELAEGLMRRLPDLKVLYMSGYTDSAVVNSGVLHKYVAFLQKPFTPAALIDKVREVLESNGKRRRAGS